MATERAATEFGKVSRLKGVLFEVISLGASVVGVVALAILLIYVAIDAFDLSNASPTWLLTYVLTVVAPFVMFCLYSANDRALVRRTIFGLGSGLAITSLVFYGIEVVIRPIPRLTWPLAYLFVVVVPVTAYVAFVGSQNPIGRVGFGLVGRLLGGVGLGLALIVLFTVFDERLWFLAYMLGILPSVGIAVYSRLRPQSLASLLVIPVAVIGFGTATVLRGYVTVSLTPWGIYVWTFAVPVSVAATVLTVDRYGYRVASVIGGLALLLLVAGSFAAGLVGIDPAHALLILSTVGVPIVVYTHRIFRAGEGKIGLVLPMMLVGGVVTGWLVVGSLGVAAPDPWLDLSYVTNAPSRHPREAGLYPAIVGSVLIITLVAVLSFVLGVGTAVFLEEYTADSGVTGMLTRLIQINVANLAAVPSVVYGLLGLGLFANLLGWGFGTVVTAGVTLSLLILPITIISAQEAVRAVPGPMRQASYGMGATRWQTIRYVVLPEALSGILTGTILALGRAIGETAPLIMIGAAHTVFSGPTSIWSKVSAMPMQIFVWSDFPQEEFRYGVLAAGVVTLLIVLLGMNAAAIVIRNRSERGY